MSIDDITEKIADLSDRAENYSYAATLPIEPELHVRKLREGMQGLRDELREIYIQATGSNPWV